MRGIYSTRNLAPKPKLPAQQSPANKSMDDADEYADSPASKRLAKLLSAKFGKSAASQGLAKSKGKRKGVAGVTV